jgi:aldehyde dehydrogenase (NAD+)
VSISRSHDIPIAHQREFYIGGEWVAPSTGDTIAVDDSGTGEVFLEVAAAGESDIDRAIGAARSAFDDGPWPRLSHAERADYLRRFAVAWRRRKDDVAQIWPRESGGLAVSAGPNTESAARQYEDFAAQADTFPFEEPFQPTRGGDRGVLLREPVGVVGAIIPWNGPVTSMSHKIAPAFLAGCTVVLKSAPEAPGEGLLAGEVAEEVGLPPGVLNIVTADRGPSESLVRDPRVDKISFTGSTVVGQRIGSILGDRVARFSLELGGKSAAVILDDADLDEAARVLAAAECNISGQVCASLTRIIVSRSGHDQLVEALAAAFSRVAVGDPYDESSQMGPVASAKQRDRILGYIAKGVEDGGVLATGGGTPAGLDRGYYVEPTVFGNVDNSSVIAQEEIFGPVLCVIPAENEEDAVRLANESMYGLNASVFTKDPQRAMDVARRLQSGTVGHNAFRLDVGVSFGGYKHSGIGREGGAEGLRQYLETKAVILNDASR